MEQLLVKPYLLENTIQNYTWGTKNHDAFIPRLIGIDIEKDKPYAELWIGVHPNGPSKVIVNGTKIPLDGFINEYPEIILGQKTTDTWSGKLPFLFKVLSASEALSIQTHPNKSQAKVLHSIAPHNYPDSNHKPELAIALDELTALIGFRSYEDSVLSLHKYPELRKFVKRDFLTKVPYSVDQKQQWIRGLITKLLKRSTSAPKVLAESLSQLENRLKCSTENTDEEQDLFLSLQEKYSNDVGLFFIFLLNVIHLKKGQGVFIKPGIPHAYLKGNIIECMANSDNVVRAGLTPKFKDIPMLVDILTYESDPIDILEDPTNSKEHVYPISVPEFEISHMLLDIDEKRSMVCKSIEILLIVNGSISIECNERSIVYSKGSVVLIPAALQIYQIFSHDTSTEFFKVTIPVT